MTTDLLLSLIACALVLIGLVGTIVPAIPGLPLIWLGFVFEASATSFSDSMVTIPLIIIALTTGLFYLLQIITAPMATKHFGGTSWGAGGAILGLILAIATSYSLISFFVLPLFGAIVGELANGQSHQQAMKSGFGAIIGLLVGTAIEFALGLSFTAWFIFSLATN